MAGAEGSLAELEAALEVCLDLQYFTQDLYSEQEKKRGEVAYLLFQLIRSLQ